MRTRASAQSVASSYGLGGNPAFVQDLQTLGLRIYEDQDKALYSELKTQVSARNFTAP